MKLAHLSPLLHRPGPWASVYFDTTRTTPDAARQEELRARGTRDRLSAQGADRATCEALYDVLAALPPPKAPGRALFATGGEVVLDEALAERPPSSLTSWTALPHLGPLLDLAPREPVCLVAYVDRRGADLALRGRRGGPPASGPVRGQDWPMNRTTSSDWSERHFQLAVENTWEENAARIAEALAHDVERTGAELLVLCGDRRERHAVRDRLPKSFPAATVESDHGGRAAGSASPHLEEDIAAARAEYLRARTEETLNRFLAGRAAAEGVPALVDAAREHRIETLLVRSGGGDLRRDVWVGEEPDQLAVRRTESQYLGEPRPAVARADDALLRSAAATGAEVVPLPGDGGGAGDGDGGAPAGGLGALLRWP